MAKNICSGGNLWLWTYFIPFSTVSIIDFEQINISWDIIVKLNQMVHSCNVLLTLNLVLMAMMGEMKYTNGHWAKMD